ncbi:MAG: hypothetical protein GF308_19010 [Candidatus Heimdallarchaeota archaeon]|nr:hypothetical protein [Candidatus Heimdallarchaeota archaeon]
MVNKRSGNYAKNLIVVIKGIKGGKGLRRNSPVNYRCFINVSGWPNIDEVDIWFLKPPNDEIKHVNIFPPRDCPYLGRRLPYLCYGNLNTKLEGHETLLFFLGGLKTVLNNQNFSSPARSY